MEVSFPIALYTRINILQIFLVALTEAVMKSVMILNFSVGTFFAWH